MGAQDNGLTLEGLAHRLQTLERENAELRHKVATLEGSATKRNELVPLLRGSESNRDQEEEPVSEFAGRVSRKALLSKAGAAAVAAVAAGTLLSPRQAKAFHHADGISVDFVRTHWVSAQADNGELALIAGTISNTNPALRASNNGLRPAVDASNVGAGEGVLGDSRSGTGVKGSGVTGVWGSSGHTGQAGVYGQHVGDLPGPGVVGDANGPGHAGVLGRNSSAGFEAFGLKGETVDGVGVKGTGKVGVIGESPTLGHASVYGRHIGSSGYGVVGDGTGSTGAGVFGRNLNGSGVEGRDSRYGGKFAGSRAQLMLEPKSAAGKPTTGAHTKGEIYMDSAGTLFVCVASSTSTAAAKWRKVTTTAV